MLNKKRLYWFFQITGWLIYVVIVGVFNILTEKELTSELVYSLLAIYLIVLSIAHAFRSLVVKLNWIGLSIPRLIPRILLATIASAILVYLLKSVIIEWVIANNPYQINLQDAFPSVISWTLLYLIWSLLYFLFHYVNNYKKEEIKNLRWQAAKNEMELNKLKSQLNPHFIFNSMNSIRALVDEDKSLAKNAITQLSNVLRNSLLMGKQKLIPFSDELKLVEDYLSLEKTRFEERLQIERDIEPESKKFLVPPLMIQTLVENGIKHGTSKLPEGGTVKITSKTQGDELNITIYNSGHYDSTKKSDTGFGLVNTMQRLQLLYGEAASFSITNQDGQVKTELKIPNKTIL